MAAGREEENTKADAVTSSHALNAPSPQTHGGRHLPRRSPAVSEAERQPTYRDPGRWENCPLSGSVVHPPRVVCRLQTALDPSSRSDLDPEGSTPWPGAAGLLPTGPSMKPFSSCSPRETGRRVTLDTMNGR